MNYINHNNIHLGKKVIIHAYKFNGWLYRSWEYPIVIDKNDKYYVLASDDAEIITSEFNTKRCFRSNIKNRTFWVFFTDKWYNLLITLKPDNKISYYINISSKFIYEESAFKYYDFDLDFKIFSSGSWCEVDVNEFKEGIDKYGYTPDLITIIKSSEKEVISLIESGYFTSTFNQKLINKYNNIYNRINPNVSLTRAFPTEDKDER